MLSFKSFFQDNLGIVLVISAIIGFFIPQLFIPLINLTDEIMMLALFLGFLKIDFSEITHLHNNKMKMLWLIILYLIFIPIAFFYSSFFIEQDIRLGIFLLYSMSSAVVVPLLANMWNLKILWATVFTVITSFLMPITMPFLVKFFWGMQVKIPLLEMVLFLCKMIFIPAIFAMLIRKISAKTSNYIKSLSHILGVICMSIFLATLVAQNEIILSQKLISYFGLISILWLFFSTSILFLIGYYAGGINIDQKQKFTNSLMFGNMNNGLGVILSVQFFSSEVSLVLLLSFIPWALSQLVFAKIMAYKI